MKLKLTSIALFSLALTACGGDDSSTAASSTASNAPKDSVKTLRRGNGAEPGTLDPHKAQGVPASNVLRDILEGLVSEKPNGELIPGAAERWEMSPDGTRYLFHLRKNAIWSNGDPVTAADFVFSLRRSVDPKTGSEYANILAPIANAQDIIEGKLPPEKLGVAALGDYQLEIRLNAATPYFLGLLTHSTSWPVHPASVKEHGDQFTRPENFVGNGAYTLDDWVVRSHIRLRRNPKYWDNDQTKIEIVEYLPIEDADSALKRYRAGELDWASNVPSSQMDWIKKNLADELLISPLLGTYYYGLNLKQAPFKGKPKLRRALSLAINRQIIIDKIGKLNQIPAYGWVPPGTLNHQAPQLDIANWTQQEREAEAAKLYAQAGFSKDQPAEIEILYNTSEGHKKIAIAISQMWKQTLGVKTTLRNQEWKVYLDARQGGKTQAYRAGWIGDYNDPYTFAEILWSKHGMNDMGYKNPEYDDLLMQASTEVDLKKRSTILQKAEEVMLADQPIIPIYFYVSARLVKPRVSGYEANIMGHHYSKNLDVEL